jgi:3-oxoacyl-[acyl-carrier protein] reductase
MKEIAIITGGSRGIGKAIAISLAKDGFDIWINYNKNKESAIETQKEISTIGMECKILQFDVSSKDSVRAVLSKEIENVNKDTHRISVLVNNAGIIKDNIFHWMTDEEWEDVINTDLNGFFYVTKSVINHMTGNKKGSIVNISSISGIIGNYAQANYSAAKAGIIAATKTLSKELARSNVRVNAVVPGFIITDMTKEMAENSELKKMIPMRRFGKAEEIANVVSFLCSDKASYITGAVLNVTGGLYT